MQLHFIVEELYNIYYYINALQFKLAQIEHAMFIIRTSKSSDIWTPPHISPLNLIGIGIGLY